MRVGVPKEIKKDESRVSLVPSSVKFLTEKGIKVFVQSEAGKTIGYSDKDYENVGAIICNDSQSLYDSSDLIVKVKEPQTSEYSFITSKHTVFSFFHGVPGLLEAMCKVNATCIAYERMYDESGYMPILAPMSKIAGEEAVIQGSAYITNPIKESIVTIIGAGVVGCSAADIAILMGFEKVILLDNNIDRLHTMNIAGYNTAFASPPNIQRSIMLSHLTIGAIHTKGQKAPILITKDMLDKIDHKSVFVDVSIDQGGMTEVSKITSISEPTFIYNNTTMYCVPNIPGSVQHRASNELSDAIVEYVKQLALYGVGIACQNNSVLANGLVVLNGVIQSCLGAT